MAERQDHYSPKTKGSISILVGQAAQDAQNLATPEQMMIITAAQNESPPRLLGNIPAFGLTYAEAECIILMLDWHYPITMSEYNAQKSWTLEEESFTGLIDLETDDWSSFW